MSIPNNAHYLRNWSLQVYSTQTVVTPNPLGSPPVRTEITPVSGEPHITATQPAGIESSLTQGLDLSQLRSTFEITAADTMLPNIAIIRIYNVAPDTANKITNNFVDGIAPPNKSIATRVRLQAGYGNNLATIFDGEVIQAFQGRENPTDTFVLLHAADGDTFMAFSTLQGSLAAGTGPKELYDAIRRNATYADQITFPKELPINPQGPIGGVYPRGQVYFGATRIMLEKLANDTGHSISVQNGKLTFIPRNGPLTGTPIELTSQTGVIGLPIRTNQGIRIRTLILPQVQIGSLVHLNNKSIQQSLVNFNPSVQTGNLLLDKNSLLAHISDDGLYTVFAIEYSGDSRGDEWYQDLTCLSVDPISRIPADIETMPPGGSPPPIT